MRNQDVWQDFPILIQSNEWAWMPFTTLDVSQPVSLRSAASCQAKDDLAQAIMTAIRKHLGRQQHSALEKAIRQLVSSGAHTLPIAKSSESS